LNPNFPKARRIAGPPAAISGDGRISDNSGWTCPLRNHFRKQVAGGRTPDNPAIYRKESIFWTPRQVLRLPQPVNLLVCHGANPYTGLAGMFIPF